jgi:hypothetical protein
MLANLHPLFATQSSTIPAFCILKSSIKDTDEYGPTSNLVIDFAYQLEMTILPYQQINNFRRAKITQCFP